MKGFVMSLSILLLCMIFLSMIYVEMPKVQIKQNVVVKEKPLNMINSSEEAYITLNNTSNVT